jgi:hypothetical protein
LDALKANHAAVAKLPELLGVGERYPVVREETRKSCISTSGHRGL